MVRRFISIIVILWDAVLTSALAQFVPPPLPPPLPPPFQAPMPMGPPVVLRHGPHPVFGEMCSIPPRPPAPCPMVERYARVLTVLPSIQVAPQFFPPPIGYACVWLNQPRACEDVRFLNAALQVARQEFPLQQIAQDAIFGAICAGPLGPGPCDAIWLYLMQTDGGAAPPPNFDPRQVQLAPTPGPGGVQMCAGPFGQLPCSVVAQMGMDRMGGPMPAQASFGLPPGLNPQQLAAACAKKSGLDVPIFAACTGRQIVLPESQQKVLDCAVSSKTAEQFGRCAAPQLGITLSNDQRVLVGCADKSRGDARTFAACAGGAFAEANLGQKEQAILKCASGGGGLEAFAQCAGPHVLRRDQEAVLRCAVGSGSVQSFATCAAPNVGIKMSDDQRVLVRCAAQAKGERNAFLGCAGASFVGRNLGPREQAVLACAASSSGDVGNFAGCAAGQLLGNNLSREQQIALKCAAQSQGDAVGMATCAGTNMFGMQLNPEQQIAVQCVVSTGGQPYAAAGCMASRLTARELTKCFSDGVGGRGCFGDSNDLVGKDGWLRRSLASVAGGPNSVINNPDQIWGGDNSFVRNPGQIFGGRNSFFNRPEQVFGGPNSVFNQARQLLPQPKPVQVGSIGGKRICLPWC